MEGIANSVDPDQTAHLWFYTVCPDLSDRKLRDSMVQTMPVTNIHSGEWLIIQRMARHGSSV